MDNGPHSDPHASHVPDAIERRSTRPGPPVTAIVMAVVLALMVALIVCRWTFTDVTDDEIINNVILGITIPLVALASLWHQSATAAKQRRWVAARHCEREAAEERLHAGQTEILRLLNRPAPSQGVPKRRRRPQAARQYTAEDLAAMANGENVVPIPGPGAISLVQRLVAREINGTLKGPNGRSR